VPGFLPDIPDVRKEIAQYYCSVRRCDDTVGAVMRALRESGNAKNTLVMFLSDNGMALPFSKTNCYLHSTRTPWIASWPTPATIRLSPGSTATPSTSMRWWSGGRDKSAPNGLPTVLR